MRVQTLTLHLNQLKPIALLKLWVCLIFSTPVFSQDVHISGELRDGGTYKILFPGKPLKTWSKNELYNKIETTTYHWKDKTTEVLFRIVDDGEFQQLDHNDKFIQDGYFARFLGDYTRKYSPAFMYNRPTNFTYQANTRFAIKGLRTDLDEIKTKRKGVIYSIYTGTAGYGLLILGMSKQEALRYVESLELAPYPPNDTTAQEALSKKISILLNGTKPYQSPPYPKRTLAPQTGGWGYIHAPPEQAAAPGTITELDPLFEQCREGEATACDEMVKYVYLHSRDLGYEAGPYLYFGRTCGGRTLSQYCRTLLHGEAVSTATDVTNMSQYSEYQLRNEQLDLTMIAPPESAPPQTRSAALDLLWLECGINAQPESCHQLNKQTGFIDLSLHKGNPYSAFAQSCGGRTSMVEQDCTSVISPDKVSNRSTKGLAVSVPELDSLMEQCRSTNGEPCFQLRSKATSAWLTSKTYDDDSPYRPYFDFGKTCGGVADRPVTQRYCGDFSTWPTVGQ